MAQTNYMTVVRKSLANITSEVRWQLGIKFSTFDGDAKTKREQDIM